MALSHTYIEKKGGKKELSMLLFATWGVENMTVDWAIRTYGKRFGIESVYRQKNQAKVRTSTKNPRLRLLFFFTATLVRQFWVGLHDQVLSTPCQGKRKINYEIMILESFLEICRKQLEDELVLRTECPAPSGVKQRLAAFIKSFQHSISLVPPAKT